MAGPKADRLRLFHATAMNLSPIFGLYPDEAGAVQSQLDQAVRISLAIDPPFALDIIVRTPKNMQWRLAEGESFLTEVVSRGKVLYEKDNEGMGAQGRGRPPGRRQAQSRKRSPA